MDIPAYETGPPIPEEPTLADIVRMAAKSILHEKDNSPAIWIDDVDKWSDEITDEFIRIMELPNGGIVP